jgi:hypothetical protein
MPFEDPGLWAARSEWPHAPLNFVFLLDAVVRVAQAMCESDWSAQFVPADDPENFGRVIRKIGEACEAGELRSFYRRPTGEIEPMDPADWRWTSQEIPKAWQIFFHSGQLLENDLWLLAERDAVTSSLVPPFNVCWIFVRRHDLDRFISEIGTALQPTRSGLPGRPTSIQLIDEELDRRIAALKAGQFLGPDTKKVSASLSDWRKEHHPREPAATGKTIANNLRAKIRKHVGSRARK